MPVKRYKVRFKDGAELILPARDSTSAAKQAARLAGAASCRLRLTYDEYVARTRVTSVKQVRT